jgi:hypothetical protein
MADDLEARMRARMTAAAPVARKAGDAQASVAGETAGATVRITVDLTRAQHRALRLAALDRGVSGMDIVRAFLDDLVEGGQASAEILAERVRSY